VIIGYAFASLLWVAIVSAAAWVLAGVTARSALAGDQAAWRMPEQPAQPPATRPYLIMNPRSGGGKVEKFGLKRKAEELGAEVFLMSGPGPVDVAEVAREAVARGADLLGVAGRRRHTGPGGQHRRPAWHPFHGDHRGNARPARAMKPRNRLTDGRGR
jgi:hypothetical protein